MKTEKVIVHLYLTQEAQKKFKVMVAKEGTTMSAWLENYLKNIQ